MQAATVRSVSFSGTGAGNFPLTWAQKWLWRVIALNAPHIQRMNMRASLEIPPGVDLDTAVEAIGLLLDRHRTLRTRFYVDENGTPRQAVSGAGELRVEVHETDGRHLPEFTRQVSQALLATPFTPPEISIRAALVAEEGAPRRVVLAVFHMAIDAWGLKRLMQDLEVVLRALATGDEPPSAESLTHPSERLDFEQSAAGVKRSQESVRYWTQQLALFRPASCPESGNAPESPRFKEVWLKSKAVSVAAHCLASP